MKFPMKFEELKLNDLLKDKVYPHFMGVVVAIDLENEKFKFLYMNGSMSTWLHKAVLNYYEKSVSK